MHSVQAPKEVVFLKAGCSRKIQQTTKSWHNFLHECLVGYSATLVTWYVYTLTGSRINCMKNETFSNWLVITIIPS